MTHDNLMCDGLTAGERAPCRSCGIEVLHPDCFGQHAEKCTHPTDEERLAAWKFAALVEGGE